MLKILFSLVVIASVLIGCQPTPADDAANEGAGTTQPGGSADERAAEGQGAQGVPAEL